MPATTVIDIGSIFVAVQPIILAVLGTIWTAASPMLITHIQRKWKFSFTQDQWDVIHSAARVAAEAAWARAEPSIVHAQIDVRNPMVATGARIAASRIPEIAKALGFTQERIEDELRELILAQLGKLQATAMATNNSVPKEAE